MSGVLAALRDAAPRVFDAAASAGAFQTGWAVIEESGFADMLLPGNPGWPGLVEICVLSGARALPFPAGAPAVTRALLAAMHLTEPGFASLGVGRGMVSFGRFTGVVRDIPWGRHAGFIAVECAGQIFALAASGGALTLGENLAGEPRDSLAFREAPLVAGPLPGELLSQGALVMAALSAGALGRLLAMSIEHANTRQQFGRPLGKFQAVQQSLAVLAQESAACLTAARAAAACGSDAEFERGAAKLRACLAADQGAAIAHQIHGAIGFTQDFALQHYTRRLTAWRGELGNERFWAERLGQIACVWGAEGLWPELTARGDRQGAAEPTD